MAAAVCCFSSTSQATLVVNAGFETPGLAGWGAFNASDTTVAANVHTGLRAADFAPSSAFITQFITTPPLAAGKYLVDFWAKSDGVGTLTVGLDSATVINIVNPPSAGPGANGFTHYSFVMMPTGPGSLSFTWNDSATQHAYVDDITLTAVPEPTTMIAGALLLLPFAASTLRKLRKNRTA